MTIKLKIVLLNKIKKKKRSPVADLKGRFPVATWYRVTPMDHRSTVAPNVFPTGFRRTARSYLRGEKTRHDSAGKRKKKTMKE